MVFHIGLSAPIAEALGSTTTPEAIAAGVFAIGILCGMYASAQYLEKTRDKRRRRRSHARARNKKGRGGS